MPHIHDLIFSPFVEWPLIVIAFIAVYLVFFRDTGTKGEDKHHFKK